MLDAQIVGSGAITLDALKLRLAAQIAPRRWRAALHAWAAGVDAGQSLDDGLRLHAARLPKELRCLAGEAMRFPDPVGVLIDALKKRYEIHRSWKELRALVTYPLVLFMFALLVGSGFTWVLAQSAAFQWIDDFGLSGADYVLSNIEDQHHAILGLAMITAWCWLIAITVLLVGPPWAWMAIVGGITLIGRPLRWIALQELIARYHTFMKFGMHGHQAAVLVANSFSGGSPSVVSRTVAARIERGMPVGRALASSMLSDSLCRPALLMLDHKSGDLTQAFDDTANLLGNLVEQRCRALGTILPVLVLVMVGTVVWASMSAYLLSFMPVVVMITSF